MTRAPESEREPNAANGVGLVVSMWLLVLSNDGVMAERHVEARGIAACAG